MFSQPRGPHYLHQRGVAGPDVGELRVQVEQHEVALQLGELARTSRTPSRHRMHRPFPVSVLLSISAWKVTKVPLMKNEFITVTNRSGAPVRRCAGTGPVRRGRPGLAGSALAPTSNRRQRTTCVPSPVPCC